MLRLHLKKFVLLFAFCRSAIIYRSLHYKAVLLHGIITKYIINHVATIHLYFYFQMYRSAVAQNCRLVSHIADIIRHITV